MLIACPDCHRQYDVRDLAVGAKVRCNCGSLVKVKKVVPRQAEMLKCSSCGGTLRKGVDICGYCGSEAALADRGYGGACPECFARMARGAKFCCACGVAIEPVASLKPLNDKPCPRCDGGLAVQEFTDGSIVECTECAGIWLDADEFERISKDTEKDAVSTFVRARKESSGTVEVARETSVKYLKCPTCGEFMHRKNFASASGVVIDWCRGHGYWFDRNELEAVLAFIRDGGLESARQKQVERDKSDARITRLRNEVRADPTSYTRGHGVERGGDDLINILTRAIGRWF